MLWFRAPEKVYIKKGCLPVALRELKEVLGKKKVFIVTDSFLYHNGYTKAVTDRLDEMGITHTTFFDVAPDPSLASAKEGAAAMTAFQPDCIIAIGGGSAMDAAKIMWVLYEHPDADFLDMAMRFCDIRKRTYTFPRMGEKAYFIAIPTTAGTGSEATLVAVVADPANRVKMEFLSYHLLPDAAVLDPRMTETLPPRITAATGFDALVHAIEAATCLQRNPVSDAFAEKAMAQIVRALPRAVQNGKDRKARMVMANGSLLAGAAFSNSMVGLVHAIGHALGGVCHVAHGEAMTILLPAVMKYNLEKCKERYGELLLPLAGPEVYAATPAELRAQKTIDTLVALRQQLADLTGLPTTLSQTGRVKPEQFDEVASTALNDGAIIVNPAEANHEEIVGILREVWA